MARPQVCQAVYSCENYIFTRYHRPLVRRLNNDIGLGQRPQVFSAFEKNADHPTQPSLAQLGAQPARSFISWEMRS
jgi:hypothetical protein